jgi:hypothetical protein
MRGAQGRVLRGRNLDRERPGPAGSGLFDQDGAGIEQIEAAALHVLL